MPVVDTTTGASVNVDYRQERIHFGKSYIATFKTPDASPLADNAVLEFFIITGDVPVDFVFSAIGSGDVETAFYENTVVTNNGTGVPVVGLNRLRSLAPTPTVWRGPTITSNGDLIYNDFRTFGVEPQFTQLKGWILRPNTNYLFRAINRQGSAQPMHMLVAWDEPFG